MGTVVPALRRSSERTIPTTTTLTSATTKTTTRRGITLSPSLQKDQILETDSLLTGTRLILLTEEEGEVGREKEEVLLNMSLDPRMEEFRTKVRKIFLQDSTKLVLAPLGI